MKQILLSASAVLFCAFTGAYAQQTIHPNPHSISAPDVRIVTQPLSSERSGNGPSVQSTCSDKVTYVDRNPSATAYQVGLGGSVGFGSLYEVFPSFSGTITEVYVTAMKNGTANSNIRIGVVPLSGGQPTYNTIGSEYSATVSSTSFTEYGGALTTAATVTNGFALVVYVLSANDSCIVKANSDANTMDRSWYDMGSAATIASFYSDLGYSLDICLRPKIQFTAPTVTATANPTSGCVGANINFSSSLNAPPMHFSDYDTYNTGNVTYSWGFGDSQTSTQSAPAHAYATGGNFTATCTITTSGWTSSCASSGNTSVSIGAAVPSVTIAATSTVVCASDNVTFQATPTNGGNGPTYIWKKNGFQVGTGLTYSASGFVGGDQVVCVMTSNDPCATTSTATSNTITMAQQPGSISAFSYSGTGTTIQFTSQAQNAVSFLWDFGDSQTSTAPAPSHTYASTGIYTVQLTTTNICGTTNLSFMNVNITTGMNSGSNVGVAEEQLALNGEAFPNPAGEAVNIVYSMNHAADLTIELMNNLGQVISVQKIENASAGTVQIPMAQYAAGMYMVRLTAGTGTSVLHIAHE